LAAVTRRQFLQRAVGLSLGTTAVATLSACRTRSAGVGPKRLPLIGYFGISGGQSGDLNFSAVQEGLKAFDYRDGETIHIERRHAESDPAALPAVARELIGLHPDLIIVEGKLLVPVMLDQTRTIPLVVVLPQVRPEQLIESGWIRTRAHPAGNLTGLVGTTMSLPGKQLDLLHETVPEATRLAIIRDPSIEDPYRPPPAWVREVASVAVSRIADLDGAFERFESERSELLVINTAGSGNLLTLLDRSAERALLQRLPAISGFDGYTERGGLMSYAADRASLFRGVGRFVDKILKGASPADLPVELPTTFRLAINQSVATAIGLTIPPAVLAQTTDLLG